MKENNTTLKEKLHNNLITLFYRCPNSSVDKMIFNENTKCKYHIEAIHNVENQLSNHDVYYCTPEFNPLSEFGYHYANNGSVLIANLSTKEIEFFLMFIPSIHKCDKDNYIFINECLLTFEKSKHIYINQVDGELFKTFKDVEIASFKEKVLKKIN